MGLISGFIKGLGDELKDIGRQINGMEAVRFQTNNDADEDDEDDDNWQPDIVCSSDSSPVIGNWMIDPSEAKLYRPNDAVAESKKAGKDTIQNYLTKQEEYSTLLSEAIALKRENEQQETWLQNERERWEYDLKCRRIEMEKEINLYKLETKRLSISSTQQREIEHLKMEINRLKMLLNQSF